MCVSFLITDLRQEILSTVLNYMSKVVSDSSYDFKKVLESCPQELYDGLPIPVFRGILMRDEFLGTDNS
jgi:hypothetical protein